MVELIPEETFMTEAIRVAKAWFSFWEYPIGSVIVKDWEIVSVGEVRRIRDSDPTAHAEMVAIRNACTKIGKRSLEECILYSTQECCPMCSAAIVWAKMDGVVFGAFSSDTHDQSSEQFSWRQINIPCREVLEKSFPKISVCEWFMRESCKELLILR